MKISRQRKTKPISDDIYGAYKNKPLWYCTVWLFNYTVCVTYIHVQQINLSHYNVISFKNSFNFCDRPFSFCYSCIQFLLLSFPFLFIFTSLSVGCVSVFVTTVFFFVVTISIFVTNVLTNVITVLIFVSYIIQSVKQSSLKPLKTSDKCPKTSFDYSESNI